MDVAIRGDRASCLTAQLAPRTWLFAVARGFGSVDGEPVERALLARLRARCERRARSGSFRRALDQPRSAATVVRALLAQVNAELHARSAAHADYVPAAASFTAALIVRNRAFVFHAGGTAAYIAHHGGVAQVSRDDVFDDGAVPLLAHGFGSAARLDLSASEVALDPGDVLVLVGHRVRGEVDRRTLIAHVEAAGPSEHVLVVRFECGDESVAPAPATLVPVWERWGWLVALVVAAAAFLLVLATAS